MTRYRNPAFALASWSALTLATAAGAQATSPKPIPTMDELVVTAQKRSERVQDVPLSVNVIGQQQLERQQINNIFDLSKLAPSLELTNAAGQSPGGGGQIRGIGTETFGVGAVGAVGIVVDGVSQGNINVSDLFDIGRVEVLKGPQGTLFGLTTSAGVLNITTRDPQFGAFSGRLRTELSGEGVAGSTGYGQQVVQGAVNVPMGDKVAMRASGSIDLRQGPNRNALDGSLDNHNSYSGRVRLLAKPTDRWTLNLNGDYSRLRGDGPDFFTVYKADPAFTAQLANCRATPASTPTPVVPSGSNRDYCTSNAIVDGNTSYGGSFTSEYAFDNFTLTSITAARHSRDVALNGLDIFRLRNAYFVVPNLPFPPFAAFFVPGHPFAPPAPTDILQTGSPNPGPTRLFTQEVRIASPSGSKLEYTAGLFYSALTTRSYGGSTLSVTDYLALGGPAIPLQSSTGTPAATVDSSKAVFGQATYHLTDQFSLIAGGRYTSEYLKQHTLSAGGVPANTRADINNFSWRLGAQYKFDPTLMTYVTVARGYKGPQFAPPATGSPPGTPSIVVRPEIPMDYEIGVKKTLFDGRVIADLSAFYMKVQDFQGQVCITDPVTQLLGCTITNFNGVETKGIEANIFGRVSDHFTVNTGLIWNRATYPKTSTNAAGVTGPYLGPDGSNLSGAQLVDAPEWKFTFSGEYSQQVFNGLEGFIGADLVYKSRIRYAPSLDPLLSYHANAVIGGQLGIRSPMGKWSANVFARNLTDEHVPVLRQAGFPAGANYGQFLSTGSFRVVGVSLEAGF